MHNSKGLARGDREGALNEGQILITRGDDMSLPRPSPEGHGIPGGALEDARIRLWLGGDRKVPTKLWR
jgi:hypothetical protein